MNQSRMGWDLLTQSAGLYRGRGLNHEGQNFTGELKLDFDPRLKVLHVDSTAVGDDQEVYHAEKSWIGYDLSGSLILWVASNNHPAVTPHRFDRIAESHGRRDVVFRFGDLHDRDSFREEITFSVFHDGSVAHCYSWGLPGGDFESRSGSKMARVT